MNRTNTASGRSRSWRAVGICLLAGGLTAGGCGKPGGESDAGDVSTGQATCDFDESEGPDESLPLTVGEPVEGYVCPTGDEDWYDLEAPAGRTILGVELEMSTGLTEVEPTYRIWSTSGQGETEEVVASPPTDASGKSLAVEHCLSKGDYKVAVRDRGDDAEDVRHPYTLTLNTRENPDDAEPNDGVDEAIGLEPTNPNTGYIACAGDVDWYEIEVPAERLVRFTVTADKPDYQPTARLFDAEQELLAAETNEASPAEKTNIDRFEVVDGAGTYYLAVSDDDDADADASVPYEVDVEYIEDSDPNEPNGQPAEATPIADGGGGLSCGADWSQSFEKIGTIGAPSDSDWFEVPLQGCKGGILEASVEIQSDSMSSAEKWELNDRLQANLTMIRPDEKSSCNEDAECRSLQRSCNSDIDCAGYFENCRPEGLCAGASVCLPGGFCGANQVQRRYRCSDHLERCQPASGKAPPANRAAFAAPVFGEEVVYLRVDDFQSDASAPDIVYNLNVRVRKDPDRHEPNNVFTNSLVDGPSAGDHRSRATEVPIYDCTGMQPLAGGSDAGLADASDAGGGPVDAAGDADATPLDANMSMDSAVDTDGDGVTDATVDTGVVDTGAADTSDGGMDTGVDTGMDTGMDTGGDADGGMGGPDLPKGCCANREWTEGRISYQNDTDWFEYQHPCPGKDCTVRLHYKTDAGKVDFVMNVYDGGSPWFSAFDSEEKAMQASKMGALGGLAESDRCFYAYHEHQHDDDPFKYAVEVRDFRELYEDRRTVKPSSREWQPGQKYSFCVEKIAETCAEPPCKDFENGGCGVPQE